MAKAARQDQSCEERYRDRLKSGGFALEAHTYEGGSVRYVVRNAAGHAVFGAGPFGHSGTSEQVENFLKAQKL